MEIVLLIVTGATLLSNAFLYRKLRKIEQPPAPVRINYQLQSASPAPPQPMTEDEIDRLLDFEAPQESTQEDAYQDQDEDWLLTVAVPVKPRPPLYAGEGLIPNYDQLSQEDIIFLLPRCTPLAIGAVRTYESANLRRQPILATVEAIIRNHYKLIR